MADRDCGIQNVMGRSALSYRAGNECFESQFGRPRLTARQGFLILPVAISTGIAGSTARKIGKP
jgi:hypothetical protein